MRQYNPTANEPHCASDYEKQQEMDLLLEQEKL